MERVQPIAKAGLHLRELTEAIIGGAIAVHQALGPGLLESAYEACLTRELELRGLLLRRQVPIALEYRNARVDCGFRADLVVEDAVLVELKASECLLPIHDAQLLTYLRLCGLRVGLLINFNAHPLRKGNRRLVR